MTIEEKKISDIYDRLYTIGSMLFIEFNPCKWENGICAEMRYYDNKREGCCHSCKYLTEEGYSVKSLPCKLWTCKYIEDKYPNLNALLQQLALLAVDVSIDPYVYRSTKVACILRK